MLTDEQKIYIEDNYLSKFDKEIAITLGILENQVRVYRKSNGLNRIRHKGEAVKCKTHTFMGVKYTIDRFVRKHEIIFVGFILKKPYYTVVTDSFHGTETKIKTIISGNLDKCIVTWEIAKAIRKDYQEFDKKQGTIKKIAKKYKLSYSETRCIIRNYSWIDENYTYKAKIDRGEDRLIEIFTDEAPKTFYEWTFDSRCHADIKLMRARYKVGIRGPKLLESAKRQKKYKIYDGEPKKTIYAWSQDPRAKVCENTIRARLNAGLTGPDVLKQKQNYNLLVTILGESKTIQDWVDDSRSQVTYNMLYSRICVTKSKCRCLRILLKKEYQEFFPCNCANAQSKSD